jgi:hypothetical protein
VDLLAFATLTAEREPFNPLAHLARGRTLCLRARQFSYALDASLGCPTFAPEAVLDLPALFKLVAPFTGVRIRRNEGSEEAFEGRGRRSRGLDEQQDALGAAAAGGLPAETRVAFHNATPRVAALGALVRTMRAQASAMWQAAAGALRRVADLVVRLSEHAFGPGLLAPAGARVLAEAQLYGAFAAACAIAYRRVAAVEAADDEEGAGEAVAGGEDARATAQRVRDAAAAQIAAEARACASALAGGLLWDGVDAQRGSGMGCGDDASALGSPQSREVAVAAAATLQTRHEQLCEALSTTPPAAGNQLLACGLDASHLAAALLAYAACVAMGGRERDASHALACSLAAQLHPQGLLRGCDPLMRAQTLAALSRLAAVYPDVAGELSTLLGPAAAGAFEAVRTGSEPDPELPELLVEGRPDSLLLAATRAAPDDWATWLATLEFAGGASDEGLRELARQRLREAVQLRHAGAGGATAAAAAAAAGEQAPPSPRAPLSVSDVWTMHAMDAWTAAGAPLSGNVDVYHFRNVIYVAAQQTAAATSAAAAAAAAGGAAGAPGGSAPPAGALGWGLAAQENGGGAAIMPLARQARALVELGMQTLAIGDAGEAEEAAQQAEQLVGDAARGLDAWLLRRQVNQKTARPGGGAAEEAAHVGPSATRLAAGGSAASHAESGAQQQAAPHQQYCGSEELLLASAGPAYVIEMTLEGVKTAIVELRRRIREASAAASGGSAPGAGPAPLGPQAALRQAKARFLAPYLA